MCVYVRDSFPYTLIHEDETYQTDHGCLTLFKNENGFASAFVLTEDRLVDEVKVKLIQGICLSI